MPETKLRIESIDILRGLAMVIMALDHVRDYFHIGANTANPLDFETTTPLLFFTRWITHFCAPVFIFLSGTSIYLQGLRKNRKELSTFLIKRGLWLIVAELTLVAFAWTFNPFFESMPFQVIWAIGISMLLFGILLRLGASYAFILITGLVLVAGHNLLDPLEARPGFDPGFWWNLLHSGVFVRYPLVPGHDVLMVYPFPPWLGVMMLGYCLGRFYSNDFPAEKRRKYLYLLGLGLTLFFIALRATNTYGNPWEWSTQKNLLFTVFSFVHTAKYPPSLLYLCMTLGPSLLLLAWMEKRKNRLTDSLLVFGRTAFFFYLAHLYLIHLLATAVFFLRGHSLSEAFKVGEQFPFLFVVPGEGFGLGLTYLWWIAVVTILYFVCRRYDRYKSRNREKVWLSYL